MAGEGRVGGEEEGKGRAGGGGEGGAERAGSQKEGECWGMSGAGEEGERNWKVRRRERVIVWGERI